jgi:phosphatidylserine decarboxylase
VNRVPIGGRISRITYHAGKFFSANLDKASEQNEHNSITLQTGDGRKVVFVQIAGLIARRIVWMLWDRDRGSVLFGSDQGWIFISLRTAVLLFNRVLK